MPSEGRIGVPGSQCSPDPGQVLPDQTLGLDPDLWQTNSGVCWARKIVFWAGFWTFPGIFGHLFGHF